MAIYRCTVKGHLPDGEIWDTTFHIDHTANDGASLLTAISSGITKWWQGPPTPANSIQQLVTPTVGVDGFVLDELNGAGRNVAQFVTVLILVGTNASEMWPHEVSMVASTRTANPIKGGSGRSYQPPMGVDQLVAGLLNSTACGQIARAVASMFTEVNTAAVGGVGVYHRGSGLIDKITGVDVGNVPDVQTRRRNGIDEIRAGAAV